MDRLPPEVLILVLKAAVYSGPKNDVLPLRLVCREFDAILKPLVCSTISLDISKLSKRSLVRHPDPDALQTIGNYCSSLSVDLMIVRDPSMPSSYRLLTRPQLTPSLAEVNYLQPHMQTQPTPGSLCEDMRKRYCMGPATFTEVDFRRRMDDILFYCRGITQARLSLPLSLVLFDELITTFILANALAALGRRPEEDSATLKVLVLENVTGTAIGSLLYNPLDRLNIMTVFAGLDHLVMSTKSNASHFPDHMLLRTTSLWKFIGMAESLKTLCLVCLECSGEPPSSPVRLSRSTAAEDGIPESDWQESILPLPFLVSMRHLTCLELRRIDLNSDFFISGAISFGSTLRELYLNKVCLKIRKTRDENDELLNERWVGPPNTSPRSNGPDRWMAHIIQKEFPEIRVCRATRLSYDFYGSAEDLEELGGLDVDDPCGLNRDLARRFVEVAMGYEQPDLETGGPCTMFPSTDQTEFLLKPAPKDLEASDWDVGAYHSEVTNPTSSWLDSLDGCFPNDRSTGITVLRDIAESTCEGLNILPGVHFHPDPPDDGFRVVYGDNIPLGILIGRIGPRRLARLGVAHGDDIDEDWGPDFDALGEWPTELSEDGLEEGIDGQSVESNSGEEDYEDFGGVGFGMDDSDEPGEDDSEE